jgi:hypothetical protein
MTPIIMPIPMPMPAPRPRDCVLVDGHRYCREDDANKKELGTTLLITFGLLAYVFFLGYLYAEKERPVLALIGLFAPPFIAGTYLVLR